jgi:Flp pilus assembly secretin CpaC
MIRQLSSVPLAAIFLAVACSSLRAEPPAEEAKPAAAKQSVTVEITVLEVNRTKLRAIGFDWDLAVTGGEPATEIAGPKNGKFGTGKQLDTFLQAIQRYDLARVISKPTLMTLSGRPASLAIGDYVKLDVVPIVLESGRIRVEHRLELAHSGVKLKSDGAVEVESGQAAVGSQVRSEKRDAAGKVHETETLVLVRAVTADAP